MVTIYSRKGQVGMMETIMVLVVIVILLSIGIFFYYKFYLEDLKQKDEGLSRVERDILLASILAMPEIQCSFNTVEQGCIDWKKIETDYINQNEQSYFTIFGSRVIKIEQTYPVENENKFTIYDRPRPNANTKEIISVPVSMYFSKEQADGEDVYTIGKLIVEDYR